MIVNSLIHSFIIDSSCDFIPKLTLCRGRHPFVAIQRWADLNLVPNWDCGCKEARQSTGDLRRDPQQVRLVRRYGTLTWEVILIRSWLAVAVVVAAAAVVAAAVAVG